MGKAAAGNVDATDRDTRPAHTLLLVEGLGSFTVRVVARVT